jgi:hypothetical protein
VSPTTVSTQAGDGAVNRGPDPPRLALQIFIWATIECAGLPQWIPAAWGLSALGACISVAYNLDSRPANTHERKGTNRVIRDGPRALAAYREWKALRKFDPARL